MGWHERNKLKTCTDWLNASLGWILTIIAVSLGAPFWFDILNKFMRVRKAGNAPHETAKSPEKQKMPPQDKAA
ncbi:MAG: hypothetical protein DMG75_01940 [Acidobacteria bacterium]|nr:MAG: hypothetical protein DMG75_01940 [Acidobacteriota bacterium]